MKDDGNFLFSNLDFPKLLYTLVKLYLMSKFFILIKRFNVLVTLVLLVLSNF